MESLKEILVVGITGILFLLTGFLSKRFAHKNRLFNNIATINDNYEKNWTYTFLFANPKQKDAYVGMMVFIFVFAVAVIPIVSIIVGLFLE